METLACFTKYIKNITLNTQQLKLINVSVDMIMMNQRVCGTSTIRRNLDA